MKKTPPELDAIVDAVLAYKPPPKTEAKGKGSEWVVMYIIPKAVRVL